MQPGEGARQSFIGTRQATKTGQPGEGSLDHPASGQEHETAFGFGQLDDFELDAFSLGGGSRFRPGIALVSKADFDASLRGRLHLLGQFTDLGALLFVGRGDQESEQVSERVHGDVDLAAFFAFVAVVTGSAAALGTALQSPAVEDRRARSMVAPGQQAQQLAQVMDHRFKAPGSHPALALLLDGLPRRKIAGQHGVEAIRDLVFIDKVYMEKFRDAIEHSASDPSLSVRACFASTLAAVAVHDEPWAVDLFKQLLHADDKLLNSRYVEDFFARGLRKFIGAFRPFIDRMLRSEIKEVRQSGGRLACLARLHHPECDDLAEAAMSGDSACRLGAAEVAKQDLTHVDCRAWCGGALGRFFNDEDGEVRRQAAGSFWHLWQQPDLPLKNFNDLISSFLESRAFADEPTYLLHALDDTRQRVPETILDVCDMFVTKCAEKARDVSTSMAADETTVGKLVFRAYAQLEARPLRRRVLELIDRMCTEGLQSTGKHLMDFER